MATIRDRGVTTISVASDTAAKIREYAKGRPVYEAVDELIDAALMKGRQQPLPGVKTSSSATKQDTNFIIQAIEAIDRKLDKFGLNAPQKEPSYTPDMLKADIKAAGEAVKGALNKAGIVTKNQARAFIDGLYSENQPENAD